MIEGGKLARERNDHHTRARRPKGFDSIGDTQELECGTLTHHLIRIGVERDGNGSNPTLSRITTRTGKQAKMAPVDTVERPDGNDARRGRRCRSIVTHTHNGCMATAHVGIRGKGCDEKVARELCTRGHVRPGHVHVRMR